MITEEIINIVNEAHDFQFSELADDLKESGHPPECWGGWVKISSHRRAGYTSAALALQQSYTSALIVTFSHPAKHHVYDLANKLGIYADWMKDQIKTYEEIFPRKDYFQGLLPEQRHQLIIIDPASMVEEHIRRRGWDMQEFRDYLFLQCDVLVELS